MSFSFKPSLTSNFSYTCQKFQITNEWSVLMWNTSVSDRCCQSCDGVVYKADSVMDTVHLEDECQTTETSVCRIFPGEKKVKVKNIFLIITLKKISIRLLLIKSIITRNVAMMKRVCKETKDLNAKHI